MVIENRVLTRIFGPKRNETDHGENCTMMKVHNPYSSPNIIICKDKGKGKGKVVPVL
jgi:hypothetical protein